MRVLFVGDIYGQPGIDMFEEHLNELKTKYRPNLIIVNGENIKNGRGIDKKIYLQLMKLGVSAVTMGNWTWGNNELLDFIDDSKIIRPANYAKAPGEGFKIINFNDKTVLVISLLGRIFMNANLENPFLVAKEIIANNPADYVFVDMHAEATSEKVALGHYLDGIANAIVGTHTHVQTNDDRMLPNGTLYISDVGMTGSSNGVIGVDKDIVLSRFLTGYSTGNVVATGKRQLNAVFLDLDKKTIDKINIKE